MKLRASGIFFLFCLVGPMVATVGYFGYQKMLVRKAIKRQIIAGIDKAELVLLKFTEQEAEAELNWEHAKEFEYNEQMYDIVETQIKGDSIYYWCWPDNAETALNRQLNVVVANVLGNDQQKNQQKEKLSSFFKSFYFTRIQTWHPHESQSSLLFYSYSNIYNSRLYPPPSPPPEIS